MPADEPAGAPERHPGKPDGVPRGPDAVVEKLVAGLAGPAAERLGQVRGSQVAGDNVPARSLSGARGVQVGRGDRMPLERDRAPRVGRAQGDQLAAGNLFCGDWLRLVIRVRVLAHSGNTPARLRIGCADTEKT